MKYYILCKGHQKIYIPKTTRDIYFNLLRQLANAGSAGIVLKYVIYWRECKRRFAGRWLKILSPHIAPLTVSHFNVHLDLKSARLIAVCKCSFSWRILSRGLRGSGKGGLQGARGCIVWLGLCVNVSRQLPMKRGRFVLVSTFLRWKWARDFLVRFLRPLWGISYHPNQLEKVLRPVLNRSAYIFRAARTWRPGRDFRHENADNFQSALWLNKAHGTPIHTLFTMLYER